MKSFYVCRDRPKTNQPLGLDDTHRIWDNLHTEECKNQEGKIQLWTQHNHRTSPWWTTWPGLVDSLQPFYLETSPPYFLCSNPSNRLQHWEQSLFLPLWMNFWTKSLQLFQYENIIPKYLVQYMFQAALLVQIIKSFKEVPIY